MDKIVSNPIMLALYRGDVAIISKLFSSDTFRPRTAPSPRFHLSPYEIIHHCSQYDKISDAAFQALLSSQKIDANTCKRLGFSCLRQLLINLDHFMSRDNYDQHGADHRVRRILALLDAGANAFSAANDGDNGGRGGTAHDLVMLLANSISDLQSHLDGEAIPDELSQLNKSRLAVWKKIAEKMNEQR